MRSRLLLLVAVAVLGLSEARGQVTPTLQQRVDALAQQLELRHASDSAMRTRYRDHAIAVVEAWNNAPKSLENRALMEAWLGSALAGAMPWGNGQMPSAPEFTAEAVAEPAPLLAESLPAPQPLARVLPSDDKGVGVSVNGPALPPEPEVVERSPKRVLTRRPTSEPAAAAAPEANAERASRSKWSRHPSAAPLEWRDPFRSNPAASPNPLRSGRRHESRRASREGSSTTIQVNLNRLRSEVRGYNAALRELQAVAMAPDCGVAELVRVVEELERLAETGAFISLYREGLVASDARALPESPSPEVIRELARRRANRLLADDAATSPSERAALRRLSDRLAGLTAPAGF